MVDILRLRLTITVRSKGVHMKRNIICLLALGLLASIAFGNDSLRCRMIDWLDAPTNRNFWHEPVNDTWPAGWSYSGTGHWDLAMGDSFMVWLSGNRSIKYMNPWNSTQIDTFFTDSGFVSADLIGCTIDSVRTFVVGDGFVFAFDFRTTYARYWSYMHTPGASYHFAALEDSFLYTHGGPLAELTCINVANPESIYIARTYEHIGANIGLEVIGGYTYSGITYSEYNETTEEVYPCFRIRKVDMINSATPVPVYSGGIFRTQKFFGGITTHDNFLYYVNTSMSDYPDWNINESYLRILGTDTSYTFDSHWDGQAVFCVETLNENIMAAGFEHGISVLNIQNLDSIYEVAYYMDLDSTMDITHLAMKESRIYAMGHPRDGYVRLYMFDVGDSVVSAINETAPVKPSAIEISAYPNPFNSSVTIAVEGVGDGSPVPFDVEIYDVNGRKIDVIARRAEPNEAISPNNRSSVPLDTRRDAVSINNCEFVWQPDPSLGSGVYLVRARVGGRGDLAPTGQAATKRIVYLK